MEELIQPDVFVFDLDGTLANCDHRQDLAKNKDWDAFHAECTKDDLYENVAQLLRVVSTSNTVIIITGRDEKYKSETVDWLTANGLMVDEIFMRPEGNREKDHIFKLGVVDKFFGDRETALRHVICWFEDRDELTEELRNAGFTVCQTKAGAY